jgi:hypothetical protein
MFKNSTVFVLGAGASWHYGYPTGEGLVDQVVSFAQRFAKYCDGRVASGQVIQLIPHYVEQRIDPKRGIEGVRAAWVHTAAECRV